MGYYTEYELGIKLDANEALLNDSSRKKIIDYIMAQEDDSYLSAFKESIKEDPDGEELWCAHDSMKWYDHNIDMRDLSLMFPDVIFELRGDGEEENDLWIKYYMNGKMQACHAEVTIEYPEFDMEKFESVKDK